MNCKGATFGELLIFIIIAFILTFGISTCKNTLADNDLKKVSATAKNEYKEFNSESWMDGIVGGNSMKKQLYATYTTIAKENHISVYDAVRNSRSKFLGQFKNHFRSLGSFFNLPKVRNVYRSDFDGKMVVIVHYTWENCSGSGDDYHCYTEHDEVTIPEINQPKYEIEDENEYAPVGTFVDAKNNDFEEEHYESGVGIEWEGVDVTNVGE